MIDVGELEQALLAEFPADDAEDWDRTGMLVGDPSRIVTGVAVALDPTVSAIDGAADAGANVLVTHHPAFLTPPASFAPAESVAVNAGAGVWRAIERGVSLLAFHTALDVSIAAQRILPGMLGLRFNRVLESLAGSSDKGYGQLCLVEDGESLTLEKLASRCVAEFGRPPRVWGNSSLVLGRIVTATGAAGCLGRACLEAGVDCLVCGEVKYHDALDWSQAGLAIVDLGHDTSELPLVSVLVDAVRRAGIPDALVTIVDQGRNWVCPEAMRV